MFISPGHPFPVWHNEHQLLRAKFSKSTQSPCRKTRLRTYTMLIVTVRNAQPSHLNESLSGRQRIARRKPNTAAQATPLKSFTTTYPMAHRLRQTSCTLKIITSIRQNGQSNGIRTHRTKMMSMPSRSTITSLEQYNPRRNGMQSSRKGT